MRRLGAALLVAASASVASFGVSACSGGGEPSVRSAQSAVDRGPCVEDAFDGPPDLLVVVRPTKLARDPLYGPLLRRASQLASAHAGLASVGTTTLAAIERAEEVILGVYDPEARDAVVAVRGVPADVDAARVVDTDGRPIWVARHELPGAVTELAPTDGSAVVLFALPRRAWVIATGAAALRARAAYAEGVHGTEAGVRAVDDAPLAVARLRGDALVRARPTLAEGALAPIVHGLASASVSLEPGPEGEVGEVVARLVYGDDGPALAAETKANEVLGAFTRRYDKTAPWLRAVRVVRRDRAVVVRGRLPRAWADGLMHLDLDAAP